MKKALLLALSIFAVFNVIAQEAILKEGGKRINGTANGQVLKWNGTSWVPGTDNAGSADSTWGKGNYASPTYSGKRIVDNIFRRAIVSLFTSDTTGVLNIKESKKTENLGGAIVVNGSSNGDSVNVYMRLKSSDTETPDFIIGGINSGVISAAGKNNSWYFGHNIYPGGTRIDTSKSATFQFFESNFTNGLPIFGNIASAEMHWGFTPKWNPLNIQSRVISTSLDHRGRVNNFGVQGDLFYIERFGRPFGFRSWDTETWLKADFYNGTWDFGDTISVRMPHNNVGGYWQRRNGADNAYIRMLMVDDLDRILLGGSGPASRVAAYNHLEVTNSGLISNENNDILIGNSSFPTRLTVESNDGSTLTLKKTGNSHSVTHGLFNSQYYIMNTATSEAPFRMDVNLPDYAFWLRANGLGLGTPSPQAKIHLTSTGGATAKMIALDNTTGTSYIYRTNATPESAITASQGDLALSNTGELYGKVSGTNTNTGWGEFLNLKDGNSASSGQVLKWDGSAWTPNADNTGTTSQPNEQVVYGTGSGISSDTSYKYSSRSLVLSDVAGTTVPKFRVNYKDATSTLTAFELRPYSQTNFPYPTKFGIYAGNFPNANGGTEPGNHVWRMGYNLGRPATRLSSLEISFESLYREAAGMLNGQRTYNLEWHIEQVDTLGGVHRPLTIRAAHNGTTGDIGLRSDGLYISRYDNDQHLIDYNRFSKTWYNQDTITNIYNKRQVGVPFMSFRSADNSRLYQMFSADASDRLVLNPEGNRLYTFAPSLYFNTAGEISTNDGNHITIGSATKPSKLRVEGNTGDLFTLIRGANSWPTNLNTDNIAYTRPNGNSYLQVYNGDAAKILIGNNKVGIGDNLQSRLSISQLTNTAEGGIGLYNTGGQATYLQTNASNNFTVGVGSGVEHLTITTAGDLKFGSTGRFKSLFAYDIAPNGNITGNPGDVLFRNNATLGELWLKVSGTGNTGWSKALALTDANSAATGDYLRWSGSSWAPATISTLPSGTSGQTLRHDGTSWIANSLLFNNGTNVGIGNTSPAQKLDVSGTVKSTGIQMTTGATNGYVLQTDASGNASWVNSTTLAVTETDPQVSSSTTNYVPKWNGTTLVDGQIFDNGTNVGIGTATPGQKLDVSGTVRGTSLWANAIGNHTALGSSVSGTTSWQLDNVSNNLWFYNGTSYSLALENGTGNMGIGNTAPSEKLHVTGNVRVTGSIKDGNNEAGTSGQFLKTTGTGTDWVNIAPSDLSQSGAASGQVIKWNGSAWAPANDAGTTYTAGTGIDVTGTVITNTAPEATTVGTFQTTSTANGLSISATDIRLHSASGTTPGAVDLTNNQVLGDNTKILQKSNAAGIGTPLVLRNPTATGDDTGVSLSFQSGASNVGVATIESRVTGGSITSGTALEIYNRNGDNVLRQAFSIDQNNTAKVEGWFGGSVGFVGTSLDVSAGLSNRKSNLQFNTAGGSLTLPITNVAEGTTVSINSIYESGANSTINTAAAYSEFAYDTDQDAGTGGNQFYTASISVAPMQSLTLKAMSISGELRWKVLSSGSGGGGGTATTLDDAYNNFGATASKINVDAAQSQTGGLEIETSGANDFVIDLQGTGDFKVQDAGTDVFRLHDNGYASFGNIAPNTAQRLVVAQDGASSVGTPIRADNGATVVDNGGTQIALAYNGFDRLNLKAYNPSGSYLNAASIETTSGANITFTDDIRETRFNAAIAREITTVTATTHQCDGRTSFVRVPSSATTTTITLPEIVSGAAGSNQVNVGYELYFSINRSVAVTINRAGTSDVFLIDSQSNSSLPTFIQTTGNLIFGKKLIASGLDEWTVVQ